MTIEQAVWPASRLGEALAALARHSKVCPAAPGIANPVHGEAIGAWLEHSARRIGCEAEQIVMPLAQLETKLQGIAPAILRVHEDAYLVVLRSRRNSLLVLPPSLRPGTVRTGALAEILREPHTEPHREEIEQILDDAQITGKDRCRASESLLRERLGNARFDACWSVHVAPGAGLRLWLGQADILRNAGLLVAAHTAQLLLWILSWWVIGQGVLSGRFDTGLIQAWALLLLTLIPFRLLSTWMQSILGIGIGGLLKDRLLVGAMKLKPEEVRRQGIGQFLGQVLEAEALESLAFGGAIGSLLALIELICAGFLLGPWAVLLMLWCGVAALVTKRFSRCFEMWSGKREQMTQDLVEAMVGHRTRLAQQPREEWHDSEDRDLDEYLQQSRQLDRAGTMLVVGIPRGWLLLGLGALGWGFTGQSQDLGATAMLLGGALVGWTALRRLTASLADVAAAAVAWKGAGPLFRAAARPDVHGESLVASSRTAAPVKVLETDGLVFRHRDAGAPVLDGCQLSVSAGDQILLEGSSGGGKSTLASVLAGLRQPERGLLLAGGLDYTSLGSDRWAKKVVAAPQFHENHVFTETFCFNLLMGRQWPPTAADVQEAEALCRELGLGDLLDKMPAGILQMVGEGGWQLSHGERSRLFLARALLQGSDMVILDESFASLDPENLHIALRCAVGRAKTLMVIAHP